MVQSHNDRAEVPPVNAWLVAQCPSCDCRGEFHFGGIQRYPETVARAAGVPMVIRLWSCPSCHSTFAEQELAA